MRSVRVALPLIVPALIACADCPDPFELSERHTARLGETVVLTVPDGELTVVGRERTAVMVVEARGCRGRDARIVRDSTMSQRSGMRVIARHADVRATVPAGSEVIIRHGSGDTGLRALGPTTLETRGGDVRIEQIVGGLVVRAGPGTLYVRDVMGDVAIADGPGAVFVEGVIGDVRVRDGSGGLHVRDVEGGVRIEADGSGAIDARAIAGDFIVAAKLEDLRRVRYEDIGGRVELPD